MTDGDGGNTGVIPVEPGQFGVPVEVVRPAAVVPVAEGSGDDLTDEQKQQLDEMLPPILFKESLPPELLDIPPRARCVITLSALGYSKGDIAAMLNIKPVSVHKYKQAYDPDRKFRLNKEQLAEVRRWKWQQLALKAQDRLLAEGALDGADAKTLLKVAKDSEDVLEKDMQVKEVKKTVGDLLKRIRSEKVVEGESKVIEAKVEG